MFYIGLLAFILTCNVKVDVSVQNDFNVLKPYSIENSTVHTFNSVKLTRSYQLLIKQHQVIKTLKIQSVIFRWFTLMMVRHHFQLFSALYDQEPLQVYLNQLF